MPLLNIICPICTETFENEDDIYGTSCGHLFHFACLNDWQRRGTSCPQCRQHNPTSHKMYLSFDDTLENSEELEEIRSELEEIRLQLESSNEKITALLIERNEAETNFMKLQAQYTEASELLKDLEGYIQKMVTENESKPKELELKNLENDSIKPSLAAEPNSLPDSTLSEKMKTLENKLNNISKEFEKNAKLLSSMEKSEKIPPKQVHKKSSSEQNGNKNNRNNDPISKSNSNTSIFIRDLPLELVTLPLENIIVNLAANMKVTITADDLVKVSFNKNVTNDYSKTPQLVAEFKTSELKTKFLSSKHMLKTNRETSGMNIFSDCISDPNYSLLTYAKEKLLNNGFNHVFHKNGKILAKKFKAHHKTMYIHSKAHVDKLYEGNKKASVPEKMNNENNVDENLNQL